MTEDILSPRRAALDLLATVIRRRHPLDDALNDNPLFNRLSQRDRAFARNLVSTTLRRLGQIDDLIGRCLERPLPAKIAPVSDILRLGVVQLLFTRTPPHAALDCSVRLSRDRGFDRYDKLVNAVLRKIDRQGREWLTEQDAARLNTPDWLWRSWSLAYGGDTCRAIAEAHLQEVPLDLTVAKEPRQWAERLAAELLPGGSLRLGREAVSQRGGVPSLAGYEQGGWWVQDAAAAIPARLLGDIGGQSVIDLCAAPGGKTAQLAAAGATVTALDRSPKRLERLQQNMQRLGLTVTTVTADAAGWRPAQPADAVLLDAPCTATGTIRRHPDILHLKTQADADKLAAVQDRLLSATLEMVRPGGTIIFCSCSLQREEGPERVAAFLRDHANARRRPIEAAEVGGMAELLDHSGDLRCLPHMMAERGGMDGFFAARMVRL